MRFYVQQDERVVQDPQEESAMLKHRIDSIKYQQVLLERKKLAYAFKSENGRSTFMMYESDKLEEVDKLLNRDPLSPYAINSVLPVVSTQSMIHEIEEFLGKKILSTKEIASLAQKPFHIDPNGSYVLIQKMIKPFSPLLSKDEQIDILVRTVRSQRLHNSPIEMSDDNPVGKAMGILIVKSKNVEKVRNHIASTEIYPDTVNEIIPIKTLEQSLIQTTRRLHELGRNFRKD